MKLIIFLFMLMSVVFANESVEIKVSPQRPVQNEEFSVEFTLRKPHGENSNISFNPIGVEVLDSNITGRSTRTTYINGKLSVDSLISVTYRMLAKGVGNAFLNDIRIETDGKITNLPSKRIMIVREPVRPKDVFALAVPSKTEVYAGESIVIRYYIYHSLPLQEFKIDKYAKLDKFLKRFHQDAMSVERVNYDGIIYTRRVVYTAQLFPNIAGTYKLDPMEFTVHYSSGRSIDPFNSIFSGAQIRKKTLRSEPVEIKVKSLPIENVPADFTGLVGKHDFSLEMNKTKYLTNEPIELKFTVKGTGALELYESPKILTGQELEEFVSDADLNVRPDFTATKSFNMTYLGREAVKIPPKDISFSYFDPDTEKFVTQKITFQGIEVIASQANTIESKNVDANLNNSAPVAENSTKNSEVLSKFDYFTPIYYFENTYLRYAKYFNLFLFSILLLLGGFKLYSFISYRSMKRNYGHIELLRSKGIDYKNLYNVVQMLGNGRDMKDIIENSRLNSATKKYLKNMVDVCEKEYLEKGVVKGKRIKIKYLKDIVRVVS